MELNLWGSNKNEHSLGKKVIDTHLEQTKHIVKLLPHTNDLL